MRILFSPDNGKTVTYLKPAQVNAALEEPAGILWVDLDGDDPDEVQKILTRSFAFHPLAIDDTLNETHLPKVDNWDRYLYLVLRAVVYQAEQQRVRLPELDIFLGDRFLVTYHEVPLDALEGIWNSCQKDERLLQSGPAYLLYRLIDKMIDESLAIIEKMEDTVEGIESQILENPRPRTQAAIMRLKHAVLQLRRVLSLQREVLNQLARDPYPVIADEDRLYFRDLYDHLIRLYDMADGVRDLTMGAMDLYLSAANNRMNDIMKTLTVITTLFMPLTFLTGFFGMNFFQPALPSLSIWTGRVSFVLTLLLMSLLPFFMFLWMRRRAWME